VGLFALPLALSGQIPVGTEYDAPTGGTLVFEELYGSGTGRVGSGSLDIDSLQSTNENSITFNTNGSSSINVTLDLTGILDVNTQDYVIDFGIVSWFTSNSGSAYSMQYIVASNSGGRFTYVVTPAEDTLFGLGNASETVSFPQTQETVFRLSATAINSGSSTNAALVGLSEDIASCTIGGTASSKILVIGSGSGAASQIELAWLRIYTGTSDFTAPLSAIPESSSLSWSVLVLLAAFGWKTRRWMARR
jgi:hypothetical protein